jgi:hypothetical protein
MVTSRDSYRGSAWLTPPPSLPESDDAGVVFPIGDVTVTDTEDQPIIQGVAARRLILARRM